FWMCDGTAGGVLNGVGPSTTLASEVMVRQIQHLLLRFAIQSAVSYRPATCNGKVFDAWKLVVLGDSYRTFQAYIPLWEDKARKLGEMVSRDRWPKSGVPGI